MESFAYKGGQVEYNGKTLTLTEDPYVGDIGFEAHAQDDQENWYKIFWDIKDGDFDDLSDAADWEDYKIARA